MADRHISMCEGVFRADRHGEFRCHVSNSSRSPVILYRHTKLARYEILRQSEICPFPEVSVNEIVTPAVPITDKCHLENIQATAKIGNSLTPSFQKRAILRILSQFSSCFSRSDDDLGFTDAVVHTIPLKTRDPITAPVRPIPVQKRETVEKIVANLLRLGVIAETSSPYNAPIVIVKKKDSGDRFCTDFRMLNDQTVIPFVAPASITEILSSLHGCRYFTTLDLTSGYYQCGIAEEDQQKTAFRTHQSQYCYLKLAMGLSGAVATFTALMNKVLKGLIWKEHIYCYLDDILVATPTFDQHTRSLTLLLTRLKEYNLKCKLRKCDFLRSELLYLGYRISPSGIGVDPAKTIVIDNFPRPSTMHSLQRFLGLCCFYHTHIPTFSSIAGPLYSLLAKGSRFVWGDKQEQAFLELKRRLCSPPVLAFPCFNPKYSFVIQTDANDRALSAILCQDTGKGEQVLQYASRTLTSSEKNYPVVKKEAAAILFGLKKFRHIIYGHPSIIIQSDHKPLSYIFSSKNTNALLARWAMKIQEFAPQLLYKRGRDNVNADTLSRMYDDPPLPYGPRTSSTTVAAIQTRTKKYPSVPVTPRPVDLTTSIADAQQRDVFCSAMMGFLTAASLPSDCALRKRILIQAPYFCCYDSHLYFTKDDSMRLYVPADLQTTVLKTFHDSSFAGHFAVRKTYARIAESYFWYNMRASVLTYCRACVPCQRYNAPNPTPRAPLKPMMASGPFSQIASDILGPISPTSSQFRYILVFSDYFTCYAISVPLSTITAESVCRAFMKYIVWRFGVPEKWLTDRGANFCSVLIKNISLALGTCKVETVPFHPACDGKVERFNKTCIALLSKQCYECQEAWSDYVEPVTFAFNTSVHETIRNTPFHALHCFDPRLPLPQNICGPTLAPNAAPDDYRSAVLSHIDVCRRTIAQSTELQQAKQKASYDSSCTKRRYQVGDLVYYKTFVHAKFDLRYSGPYRVQAAPEPNLVLMPLQNPNSAPLTVHQNHCKPHVNLSPDLILLPHKSAEGTPSTVSDTHDTSVRPLARPKRANAKPSESPSTSKRSAPMGTTRAAGSRYNLRSRPIHFLEGKES